jgi:hypothetical protein
VSADPKDEDLSDEKLLERLGDVLKKGDGKG